MTHINFSALPLFKGLDRIDIAKLIPSLINEQFHAGDTLFRQGDPGDSLYIIVKGKVRVFLETGSENPKEIATLDHGECVGEMALLTGTPRSATVQALTDTTLLKLPKESFDELLKKHQSLSIHFAGLLAGRLAPVSSSPAHAETNDEHDLYFDEPSLSATTSRGTSKTKALLILKNKQILIVILLATLCTLTTVYLKNAGFSSSHIILIDLLLAATIIWSFDIFSYHAVSIALPMFTVIFGVSKPEKAFSGFSNPYWFLALGVFALSAAILRTGLLFRLSLMIMKRFPPNYLGQTFALAFSGMVLTPAIPSSYGRAILASPIALTMSETMRLKKGSPGTIGIAMSCMLGFGHMSFMFMNGTASCAFVLGLMPESASRAITWDYWFKAAFPLGIFFFLLSYLAIIILYKPKDLTKLSPMVVEAQLKALGPWTLHEKISLFTVLFSILGFATEHYHHIAEAWVAMFAFLILFASSVLDDKTLRNDMDWSFILSFGAMIGFGDILTESGLSAVIVAGVKPYLAMFSGSTLLFLLAFSIAVHVLRLALPLTPALLVSMLSIMPVVASTGINPFVLGLVALISSNPWILMQQSGIYKIIWKATGGKLFHHEDTVKMAFLHMVIVLVAVAMSFPYWQYLGLVN